MKPGERRALILTALPVEYTAVRDYLLHPREEEDDLGTNYEVGEFNSGGLPWTVCITQVSPGNVQAAVMVERAVRHFRPNVAFFVGVAGGLKDVAIGDVVAADKVYGYESGKADQSGFHPRAEVGKSTYRLIERARAEARKKDWLTKVKTTSPILPNVFLKPIAAGEKVVAANEAAIAEFLRDKYSDAVAVEMEGIGFLASLHAYPNIERLVLRGISDLLSGKENADKSGSQEIASQNAAAFAFHVLERFQGPTEPQGLSARALLQLKDRDTGPIDSTRQASPHPEGSPGGDHEALPSTIDRDLKITADSGEIYAEPSSRVGYSDTLVFSLSQRYQTENVKSVLEKLIQRNLLHDDRVRKEICELAQRLETDLQLVDAPLKEEILYRAALWHASTNQVTLAESFATQLGQEKLATKYPRLRAALAAARGEIEAAIKILVTLNQPEERAQLLVVLLEDKGPKEAKAWLETFNVRRSPEVLADWGWSAVAVCLCHEGEWDKALDLLSYYRQHKPTATKYLAYVEGVLHAGYLYPKDRRQSILSDLVPLTEHLIYETPAASHQRGEALRCFLEFEHACAPLEIDAIASRCWRAQLLLSTPDTSHEGECLLKDSIGSSSMEYIEASKLGMLLHIAASHRIAVNTENIKRYLHRSRILGVRTSEELRLEYILLRYEGNLDELIALLKTYEDQIIGAVIPGRAEWAITLIQTYVEARRLDEAEEFLRNQASEIPDTDTRQLQWMIRDARGDQTVVADVEDTLKETSDKSDLFTLCSLLLKAGNFEALRPHAIELLRLHPNKNHFLAAANCLDRLGRDKELLDLYDEFSYLVRAHASIAFEKSRTLFYCGRFKESKALLESLAGEVDPQRSISLTLNLALFTGDWISMKDTIAQERAGITEQLRDPLYLYQLAYFGAHLDPDSAITLLRQAVHSDPSNIRRLVEAGSLAVQLGYDHIGMPWIHRAAAADEGNEQIKRMTYRQTRDLLLAAQKNQVDTAKLLARSEIPLHLYCKAENLPLSHIFISQFLANKGHRDARRRTIIPIRHGSKSAIVPFSDVSSIAADLSALLLGEAAEILSLVEKTFDNILIPWSTLSMLLEEERRIRFHQPSQVEKAKRMTALIQESIIAAFTQDSNPPSWLIEEVGLHTASLLQTAHKNAGWFVTERPVFRLNAFFEDTADLKEYDKVVVTPLELILALGRLGVLSQGETNDACGEISLDSRAKAEERSMEIRPGALYLDSVAAEMLDRVEVIRKLPLFGETFIHSDVHESWNELVKVDRDVDRILETLEGLRRRLRDGLRNGKYVCRARLSRASLGPDSSEDLYGMRDALEPHKLMETLWTEDRWMSRFPSITMPCGSRIPVIGTWDILQELEHRGALSGDERYEIQFQLRSANVGVVPLEKREVRYWLDRSEIHDGQLIENAELRAVRENLQHIISTTYLQLPAEHQFLQNVQGIARDLIFEYWEESSVSLQVVELRASWILRNLLATALDCRHLLSSPAGTEGRDVPREYWKATAVFDIIHFLRLPSMEEERLIAYKAWIDRVLLQPLAASNSAIIEQLAAEMTKIAVDATRTPSAEINREGIRQFVSLLPDSVSDRIVSSRAFRQSLGIQFGTLFSVGDLPPVSFAALYLAVRNQAERRAGPIEISAIDGSRIVVVYEDNEVTVIFGTESEDRRVPMHCWRVLLPDDAMRLHEIDELLKTIAPLLREPKRLREDLAERPPTALEYRDIVLAFESSVPRTLERIGHRASEPRYLAPENIEYFEGIAGPRPGEVAKGEYLSGMFRRWVEKQINFDLKMGLNLILPIGLRSDIMAAEFLHTVPDTALMGALSSILPVSDPISKLNVLDLSIRRFKGSSYFSELAHEVLAGLLSAFNDNRTGKDYSLFDRIVTYLSVALRVMPEFRGQPNFWRQLCAWAHGARLFRIKSDTLVGDDWIDGFRAACTNFRLGVAAVLELIDSPCSRDHLVESTDIAVYMLGQIRAIRSQQSEAWVALGLDQLFPEESSGPDSDPEEELEKFRLFYQSSLPGPLDLDEEPPASTMRELGEFDFSNLEGVSLEQFPLSGGLWWALDLVCGSLSLTECARQDMDSALDVILSRRLSDQEREDLHRVFDAIAGTINKTGHTSCVRKVLELGSRMVRSECDDQWFQKIALGGLVACAAFRSKMQSMAAYSDLLVELAYVADSHSKKEFLARLIEELKYLLPVEAWFFSQSEALLKAASA